MANKSRTIECNFCDRHYSRAAYRSCLECEAHFCHTCLDDCHSRGPYKAHTLVEPVTYGEHVFHKCLEHQEKLKFFCVLCSELVCLECKVDGKHVGHVTTSVGEGKALIRKTFECKLVALGNISEVAFSNEQKLSDDTLVEGVRDVEKALEIGSNRYEEKLDATVDKLVDTIMTLKRTLLEKQKEEHRKTADIVSSGLNAYLKEDNIFELIAVSKQFQDRWPVINDNLSFEECSGFPNYRFVKQLSGLDRLQMTIHDSDTLAKYSDEECPKESKETNFTMPYVSTASNSASGSFRTPYGAVGCTDYRFGTPYFAVVQNISAMPQYTNASQEEIRLEDYEHNGIKAKTAWLKHFGAAPTPRPMRFPAPSSGGFGLARPGGFGRGFGTGFGSWRVQTPTQGTFGVRQLSGATPSWVNIPASRPVGGFPFGPSAAPNVQSNTGSIGFNTNTAHQPTTFGTGTRSSSTSHVTALNSTASTQSSSGICTQPSTWHFGPSPAASTQHSTGLFGFSNTQPNNITSSAQSNSGFNFGPPAAAGLNTIDTHISTCTTTSSSQSSDGFSFGSHAAASSNTSDTPSVTTTSNAAQYSTGFSFGSHTAASSNTSDPFILNTASVSQSGTHLFGANTATSLQPGIGAFPSTAQTINQEDQNNEGLFSSQAPDTQTNTGVFGNAATSIQTGLTLGSNSSSSSQQGLTLGGTNTSSSSPSGLLFSSNNTTNIEPGAIFGRSNTASSTQPGGLFGSTVTSTQPGGLFESTTTSTQPGGLFESTTTNTQPGGLFGSNTTNTQPGGPFRSTATSTKSGGLFGSAATSTQPGGLFGSTTTSSQPGGLFGSTSTSTQPGGLFGSTSTSTQPGGLVGSTVTTTQSGGLVGSTVTATQPGGLFGSTSTSTQPGGLVGSTVTTTQSGGLVGSTVTATQPGGLFGSTTNRNHPRGLYGSNATSTQSGGLFGSNPSNTQQSTPSNTGFSFGSAYTGKTTGGLFGLHAAPISQTSSGFGAAITVAASSDFPSSSTCEPRVQMQQAQTRSAESETAGFGTMALTSSMAAGGFGAAQSCLPVCSDPKTSESCTPTYITSDTAGFGFASSNIGPPPVLPPPVMNQASNDPLSATPNTFQIQRPQTTSRFGHTTNHIQNTPGVLDDVQNDHISPLPNVASSPLPEHNLEEPDKEGPVYITSDMAGFGFNNSNVITDTRQDTARTRRMRLAPMGLTSSMAAGGFGVAQSSLPIRSEPGTSERSLPTYITSDTAGFGFASSNFGPPPMFPPPTMYQTSDGPPSTPQEYHVTALDGGGHASAALPAPNVPPGPRPPLYLSSHGAMSGFGCSQAFLDPQAPSNVTSADVLPDTIPSASPEPPKLVPSPPVARRHLPGRNVTSHSAGFGFGLANDTDSSGPSSGDEKEKDRGASHSTGGENTENTGPVYLSAGTAGFGYAYSNCFVPNPELSERRREPKDTIRSYTSSSERNDNDTSSDTDEDSGSPSSQQLCVEQVQNCDNNIDLGNIDSLISQMKSSAKF